MRTLYQSLMYVRAYKDMIEHIATYVYADLSYTLILQSYVAMYACVLVDCFLFLHTFQLLMYITYIRTYTPYTWKFLWYQCNFRVFRG